MSGEETLKVRPDGIETLEGGLENYQQENQEEELLTLDLTVDEKRKILNAMGKKNMTDDEILALTEEEIEELKDFAKLKEKKQIYGFVYRKKNVTDEDVKDLTDDEMKELAAKALIMSQHFNYSPKKKFDKNYKKKRQTRNKMAKRSRAANRR